MSEACSVFYTVHCTCRLMLVISLCLSLSKIILSVALRVHCMLTPVVTYGYIGCGLCQ